MINPISLKSTPATTDELLRRQNLTRQLVVLLAVVATAAVAAIMFRSRPAPSYIAWVVFLAGAAAILYRPRYGLYLTLLFGVIADTNLILWWPFTVNFSSDWSLFYLHKSLIFNPLEVYLVLTLLAWLGGQLAQRHWSVYRGPLFWPAAAFLVFVIFGLAYGLRGGGDRVIGLWEARPLLYMVVTLLLTSNLIHNRGQASTLLWYALVAVWLVSIAGNYQYFFVLKGDTTGIRSMALHATAMHMNTFFVAILAAWYYRASWTKRLVLPLMALVVVLPYFVTQRRSAFLSLAIVLALMAFLLLRDNRRLFWLLAPPAMLAALLYTGVFWNSTSAIAKPAQAIKSVIAPQQADFSDSSSNYYRIMENANLTYTIHARPLTGVGFGQKFYVVWPMADISFFDWWQYLPHNSIIWIWLKMGIGGFVAMLVLVGSAIHLGGQAIARLDKADPDLRAVALVFATYLVMHFIYAYVDISWDARSMVYVGAAMGVLNRIHRIAKEN